MVDGPLQFTVAVAFLYLFLKGFFVTVKAVIYGCYFEVPSFFFFLAEDGECASQDVCLNCVVSLAIFIFSGHNTDGKYFVTCNKLGFHCETAPKRIVFYIEKAKDGHITPVEVVEIIDFSCGSNHTVSTTTFWYVHND
jgi:hypothetical protein